MRLPAITLAKAVVPSGYFETRNIQAPTFIVIIK
jgi:hypothetical protein